jgi:MSHA pilin protein MshA
MILRHAAQPQRIKIMKSRAQAGFTLVELIVVIVILGILAAVAVPRFMGLETEARVASVKNMGGVLKSAALMAHAVCQAQSCANPSTLTIKGQTVTFVNGYPDTTTINNLVESSEGFTVAANVYTKTGAASAGCWVRYNNATATAPPTVSYRLGAITPANETTINNDLRVQC